MLETRFKIALLVVVIVFTSFAAVPALRVFFKGVAPPPEDPNLPAALVPVEAASQGSDQPIKEEMILIPAGPFIRGTAAGGFDEQPVSTVYLDSFMMDRSEVTNYQYQQFIQATGHRRAAPPARYARNLRRMSGVNQPVVYVSWEDADAYCRWKGKRLPAEAEWEKAMRGTDGRLFPWGNDQDPLASNQGLSKDGFEVTAPVGTFLKDVSPYGVADGAGNVLEWVADWYAEDAYRITSLRNPKGPEFGTFKVLRGGGYTSHGSDIRITSRSKMVPDFRDETIGFRCAVSGDRTKGGVTVTGGSKVTKNQNSTG
ncbi:MAG: formylglycine-generating enzyme family protein [Nitrospirae bacterium]|nr:MAG: formylglycine-generating enzyme family protein [Nitrospirota bacterium]